MNAQVAAHIEAHRPKKETTDKLKKLPTKQLTELYDELVMRRRMIWVLARAIEDGDMAMPEGLIRVARS